MDDPAIAGRHGVEHNWVPISNGTLSHALRDGLQLALTTLAIALHVDDNACRLILVAAQDDVGEELQSTKRFAAPANHQAGVVTLDVDHRRVVRARPCAADGRRCFDEHAA